MQLPGPDAFLPPSPPSAAFRARPERLHRTQPAVSQAIRRLEEELGDRLFDRSSQDGTLTEAGRLLQDYASRLLRLAADAERGGPRAAAGQARPGRHRRQRGGGALPAACYRDDSRSRIPQVHVEVRRVRRAPDGGGAARSALDFGVLTFQPAERGLQAVSLGARRARHAGASRPSARRGAASRSRRSAAKR